MCMCVCLCFICLVLFSILVPKHDQKDVHFQTTQIYFSASYSLFFFVISTSLSLPEANMSFCTITHTYAPRKYLLTTHTRAQTNVCLLASIQGVIWKRSLNWLLLSTYKHHMKNI